MSALHESANDPISLTMRRAPAESRPALRPMRLLWIGKQPTDGAAGDEVFDRRTIAACRARGHCIDHLHPQQVGRIRELGNLIAGIPHYRTRFASGQTHSAILKMSRSYDATICSWEPFDVLARGLSPPAILILHNVTSRALPTIFPGNPLISLAASHARAWERRIYRHQEFSAVAALSSRDLAYVRGLDDHPELQLLPPGMPPVVALRRDAPLLPELVISGTYDWTPKRRDILAFARAYAAADVKPARVRADALPPEAHANLRPTPMPTAAESAEALRFGVVTDRFEAGHKLKTLAYIAANQIVLSFADIGFDFVHIPDHEFFIRRVSSVAEIATRIGAFAAMPPAVLRDRFLTFQQACAEAFTWDAVAMSLLDLAGNVASRALGQPHANA